MPAPVVPPSAPVFLAPVSAPPALVGEPDLGAAEIDESAGQRVRQDDRTAQEIEDAVRAIHAAQPHLSRRKIAATVLVSPTKVRSILGPAKVNGREPAMAGLHAPEED